MKHSGNPVREAASLFGYPTPVQAQLARIASLAAEMTPEERGYATGVFAAVALHFGTGNGDDRCIPGAQMVSALGVLTRMAHEAAVKAAETEGA